VNRTHAAAKHDGGSYHYFLCSGESPISIHKFGQALPYATHAHCRITQAKDVPPVRCLVDKKHQACALLGTPSALLRTHIFGLLGPSVCVNAPIAEVISMHGWVVPRNTFTVEGEAHLESFEGNSAVVAHKDEGVLPDLLDEGFIRKFDILARTQTDTVVVTGGWATELPLRKIFVGETDPVDHRLDGHPLWELALTDDKQRVAVARVDKLILVGRRLDFSDEGVDLGYFGIRDLLALLAQLLCFREVGIQLRDNIVGTCSTWGYKHSQKCCRSRCNIPTADAGSHGSPWGCREA